MNKNKFAVTPPMGWNSYDYYDTSVNEEQVKANADYMAAHLKQFGWEYIVVDIEWYSYDAGSQRKQYQYIPFWEVEMDEYSRLLPCVQRFPSAAGGKGFAPLAKYIHDLGLKFGIHIMRGIPRKAAHAHTGILHSTHTANEIAQPNNICDWNPDMYGVNPEAEGAQEYYDSLMELYAQWGVDFIKCDDICRMDMPTAKEEIRMIAAAIQKSGREMVLSLSPGPAKIEEAWYYERYANMWRITDDFWDNWGLLLPMFQRCELWQSHVSEGCYPDCDMLPIGKLGKGFDDERDSCFTKEEQVTMMTLWCMFRSPLMIGADLPQLDEWTKQLLTNEGVLRLLKHSEGARQMQRSDKQAVWCSKDMEEEADYLALFNLCDTEREVCIPWDVMADYGVCAGKAEELWSGDIVNLDAVSELNIAPHGAKLFKLAR